MRQLFTSLLVSSSFISTIAFAGSIYVSPTGSDSADGSLAQPFKTVAKAASIAVAGDTVYIREGQYEETLRPANSGTATQPIVFQPYQNEKVVITAMQSLNAWTLDSGSVYKTTVNWDLGQENFVMHKATAMDLARWPNNTDGNPFTLDSKRNTGGSGPNVGLGAYLDYAPGIPDIDWSQGGTLFFYGDKPGGGWLAWRENIISNTATRVNLDLSAKNPSWIRTFHDPESTGEFFLQGVKGALDYQNEWYFDGASQTLFVQLPDGVQPADGTVKMRKRLVTVDLADRSYIEIRDLAVFGGSIELTGNASHNLIYGVSSFYGNHTVGVTSGFAAASQSVNISGNNNRIEHSEIAFGAGTGIRDAGDGTKILNSYIHDFNTLGDYNAAILARNGKNTVVQQNVVRRAGRDTIQSINPNSDFSYNDISYSNLIADDCALFYTVGGPQNSTIHHNWFHDAYSQGAKKKAAGIYLDNDSHSFSVFNNVIWNVEWTGVQINWDGTDLDIFNNTIWNASATMGAWHKEGTAFSGVRVWNNLANEASWEEQADKQNNLTASSDPFVDSANGDFRLKPASAPVDIGRDIAGITDGFVGSAPDVGAYEQGGEAWVAGVTWTLGDGAANRCYGLPGEQCGAGAVPPPTPEIVSLPGTVQAELYTQAFDTTVGNTGGEYRDGDVDITVADDLDGGYTVGWIAAGEWLEYDIDVAETRLYQVEARLASAVSGGSFDLLVDGVSVATNVSAPNTGGWLTWQTQTINIGQLAQGLHTLRIKINQGPFNINWLKFNAQNDAIDFSGALPTTLSLATTHSFTLDYVANGTRDVFVTIFDANWGWLGSAKASATVGRGSKLISTTMTRAPLAGEQLFVKIELRPEGGAWNAPGVVHKSIQVTAQ